MSRHGLVKEGWRPTAHSCKVRRHQILHVWRKLVHRVHGGHGWSTKTLSLIPSHWHGTIITYWKGTNQLRKSQQVIQVLLTWLRHALHR